MEKIIQSRGTGKTKKLIEAAKKVNGVIVCENVERMQDKMARYGCFGLRCISYVDFIEQCSLGINIGDKYFIDELETFLAMSNVEGFTLIPEAE